MKNKITLKNRFRSRFLLSVLLMAFSIPGFSQQMHIVGLDNDWSNFQSMKYSNDWGVYTFTVKPDEDGWFSWKFTQEANFGGRQWVNESNAAITFGAPIDWEFRTNFEADPPAYGAWLIKDRYYTIVMNRPYADANTEGYVFESLTAPISSVSNIEQNPIQYNVTASDDVVITLTANKAPNINETVYVYTWDGSDEVLFPFTFVDNNGTAIIPAKPEGTNVWWGIVSSFASPLVNYYDYFLLNEWDYTWQYTVINPDGAPIQYFSHQDHVDVAVDVNPTITFDKDVYKIGGAPFDVDEDVTAMIEMRLVDFSATINGRVITIVPDADLANSTEYSYWLIENVENASGVSNTWSYGWFTTIAPSVDVVFTVDMNYEVYVNGWDPVTGTVEIRGSWDQNWAAPIAMTDVDGDNVFTGILPTRFGGEEIQYKFVKEGGGWESIANRSFTVDLSAPDVPLAYFNNNILPVKSDILSFTMAEQAGDATINSEDKTISLEVLFGTNLTDLTPTFTVSPGATADVASGVARDFSSEVTYSITPYDNSAATDWTVNVTVLSAPLTDNDITSFSFAEQTGAATIDSDNAIIAIEVAYDADITNLTPAIKISAGATIDPVEADFSNPVVYTVTAQDETQKEWTVTVTLQPSYNVSLSVNMNKQFNMGAFDPATDGVAIAGNINGWSGEAIYDEGSDLIYTFTKVVPVGYYFEFKFQMLKNGTTNWEYNDNRSFTTIDGVNADTVWFSNTPFNSDATLSGITVNGNEIANFNPAQLQYDFPMPDGSVIPEVLGTVNDEYADASETQATTHPGSATILVTAEDGTELTYTVDFVVGPRNIATLSDLMVDGVTVDEFKSNKFDYWVTLPYGTTDLPEVSGTKTDQNASVEINQATDLPGSATVKVTAEDDVNSKTYTVNFMVALNDDATLSSLDLDFVSWNEFNTDQLVYIMPLTVGAYPPQITSGTTTDPNAFIIDIQNAYTVPGAALITVMAENYTNELTYRIHFTSEDASTDATLSDLTVDGITIEGFDANIFEYYPVLPYGTTAIPVVDGTATTDVLANVSVTDANQLPGATTIKVTAEDGATQLLYTIHFSIAPNFDATLIDLTVDGVTIEDFDANTMVYAMELPYGTTSVVVSGTATDVNADVENNQTSVLPGAATVVVTAEDETTQLTYTVNFTIAPHDDATLSDLTVDGVTIEDFDATTMVYAMELPYGTTSVEVLGTATDDNADVENNQASVLPGAATVVVTAEDGTTELTYTVNFSIAAPDTNAKLSGIMVDGEMIADFDADVFSYDIQIAAGTTLVPTVVATTESETASIDQTDADALPGTTVIKVLAQDGVTELEYKVNFTISVNVHDVENIVSKVYPNPTKGNVTIKLGKFSENTQLRITDMSGKTVLIQELSQWETTIDLSNNKQGIYIITVTSNDGFYMGKVVLK